MKEQMWASYVCMGSIASVCQAGASLCQSLGNTEESRLMRSFKKYIGVSILFHNSWVRRFFWDVGSLDSVPSSPSSSEWFRTHLLCFQQNLLKEHRRKTKLRYPRWCLEWKGVAGPFFHCVATGHVLCHQNSAHRLKPVHFSKSRMDQQTYFKLISIN